MDKPKINQQMTDNWHGINLTANIFLRSNLFGLLQKGAHEPVKDLVINTSPEFEIRYTGERLTQYDRDISIAMKKVALELGQDNTILFYEKDIFQKFRYKNYGAKDIQLLHASLHRMFHATYCVTQRNGSFEGKKAIEFVWDPIHNLFRLTINPAWIEFSAKNPEFSFLSLKQRMALPRGLARWLHGYWSSFTEIPACNLDTLHYLCGSQEKLRGNFKKAVYRAMQALEKIGFIQAGWSINAHGYIHVIKHNQPDYL